MKFYAIRLVAALSTFIIGLAATSLFHPIFHHKSAVDLQAEREVLQVEQEYIRSNLERDTVALDNILADEFTIRRYRYIVTNKARRLALLHNPDFAFESMKTSNVRVEVDGDTARLTGDAVLRVRDGDEEITTAPYSFARNYEKRDGRWQIVSVRVGR